MLSTTTTTFPAALGREAHMRMLCLCIVWLPSFMCSYLYISNRNVTKPRLSFWPVKIEANEPEN